MQGAPQNLNLASPSVVLNGGLRRIRPYCLEPVNRTLFGKRVLAGIELRISHEILLDYLGEAAMCPYKRQKRRDRQRKRPCEDGGRDVSHVPPAQGRLGHESWAQGWAPPQSLLGHESWAQGWVPPRSLLGHESWAQGWVPPRSLLGHESWAQGWVPPWSLQRERDPADTLSLDFWPPEPGENKFLLF